MDKLETLRLAAVRLDEANDALWFAEQELTRSRKQAHQAKVDYARALAAVPKPGSQDECSAIDAFRCSNMST